MKARGKGEGTFETRKPDGWVRHVRKIKGQRIVGPFRSGRKEAKAAWQWKYDELQRQREEDARRTALQAAGGQVSETLNDLIHYCLFGADPKPRGGVWASELAHTTYDLFVSAFRTDIRDDPVGRMRPSEITRDHLEAMRQRMLSRRTTYEKKSAPLPGERRTKALSIRETVTRRPRNPRTVMAYMRPVCRALTRVGNRAGDELGDLKLPPAKKAWLPRSEKDRFLEALGRDDLRLAARIMFHGLCRGEVCALTPEAVEEEGIRIYTQVVNTAKGALPTTSLKRPRRYRVVPISDELRTELLSRPRGERIVTLTPGALSEAFERALAGSAYSHLTPHALRRSGAKWMLDRGAKLNDVAAILGNDAKTLLVWYDTSDRHGMAEAIKAVA